MCALVRSPALRLVGMWLPVVCAMLPAGFLHAAAFCLVRL
jgi:hypothetical protein